MKKNLLAAAFGILFLLTPSCRDANTDPKTDEYESVKIGLYTWMLNNLDVGQYRNGDPIPQVTDSAEWINLKTGAWCYYNNDPQNGKKYGKLYNWYAVNDPRGLAPDGWHTANMVEWGDAISFAHDSACHLISAGTLEGGDGLWKNPVFKATNRFGFSAVPGGWRNSNGMFYDAEEAGYWWVSPAGGYTNYGVVAMYNNFAKIEKPKMKDICGFAVRCVKEVNPCE